MNISGGDGEARPGNHRASVEAYRVSAFTQTMARRSLGSSARHPITMKPQQRSLDWYAPHIVLLVAIGGATTLAGLLLSHPQSGVFWSLVDIAAWLRGAAIPAVVTWPAWGYAWVIALVPSIDWVVPLQACLGGLTLVALAVRLRSAMPRQATLIAILCVLAVPWHDIQVTLYPSALAGSLALLAFLCLDKAFANNDAKQALLAGALVGLAQNFRTELVLLPAFVGICTYGLRSTGIVKSPSLKPMWVFIGAAFVLQLPWALFYHAHANRYSLTESNLGHVMYVSLGSHPNNPWGIDGNDQAAQQAVRDAGYSFSSLSEQGNQFLLRLVVEKVKMHPYGVVGRTIQQLRNTLLAPFSWGEPELDKTDALDLDVLRQELKAQLGVGINVLKLKDYRSRGLYSQAKQNKAAILALLYQVGTVGLGCLVLLLGVLGMVLVLFHSDLRPATPLLWFLGCTAIYKILQDVLLCYQVNYLNNVYPMFLPFVAVSLTTIIDRLRGRMRVASGQSA